MAMTHASGSFGVLLLHYRTTAGLSQEELAERAGLSRRGVSDLEQGLRRSPYPATVRRLADALKLDASDRTRLLASARTSRSVAPMPGPSPVSEPDVDQVPAQLHGHTDETSEDATRTLPIQLTSFIGRTEEITELARLLQSTRLLTLTGPGGVGKTRLALRVAESSSEDYADGVGS